jgi:putative peptidoglycan lipid II flippase
MFILRKTVLVSFLTLLSRIFGYARDALVAAFLGAGTLNDIFVIVLRIPNLFRSLFGEGAMSASFIPIYAGYLRKDKDKANKFAGNIQAWLFWILSAFVVMMITIMPWFIKLTAPGIVDEAQYYNMALQLATITMPYILFISIVAFYGGILNSNGNYFAFAATPIIFNITMILFVLFLDFWDTKVHALSYSIIAAGIIELLWMIAIARNNKVIPQIHIKPKADQDAKTMLLRLLPATIGAGLVQINTFINTIIASLVVGGVSYIYYADRIYQLPLALIGTAMSTVLLPVLAKAVKDNDQEQIHKNQNDALIFCFLLTIPASVALFTIAQEVISVLFERGNFDLYDTANTAKALQIFALALPAYVLNKILVTVFHANCDTKTPVIVAALCIIVHVSISWSLLDSLKHVSIAVGSTVSSWLNVVILGTIQLRRNLLNIFKTTITKFLKFTIASLFMLACLLIAKYYSLHVDKYTTLLLLVLTGLISYFTIVFITGAVRVRDVTKGFLCK